MLRDMKDVRFYTGEAWRAVKPHVPYGATMAAVLCLTIIGGLSACARVEEAEWRMNPASAAKACDKRIQRACDIGLEEGHFTNQYLLAGSGAPTTVGPK